MCAFLKQVPLDTKFVTIMDQCPGG